MKISWHVWRSSTDMFLLIHLGVIALALSIPPLISNPDRLWQLHENTPVGTNITRLTVNRGNSKSQLKFSLTSDSSIHDYFDINPDTGDVTLKKLLNFKEHPSFDIYATVTDTAAPDTTTKSQFSIEVLPESRVGAYKPPNSHQNTPINSPESSNNAFFNTTIGEPVILPVSDQMLSMNLQKHKEEPTMRNQKTTSLSNEELSKINPTTNAFNSITTESLPTRSNVPIQILSNTQSATSAINNNNSELPTSTSNAQQIPQANSTPTPKISNLGTRLSLNVVTVLGFIIIIYQT